MKVKHIFLAAVLFLAALLSGCFPVFLHDDWHDHGHRHGRGGHDGGRGYDYDRHR